MLHRHFFAAMCLLGVTACIHGPGLEELPGEGPGKLELTRTPFFAQRDSYCGPAALASILIEAGVGIEEWQALAEQVYVPARGGSLQMEMLAATRRHQRIPFVIRPELSALVAEIGAGRPVLVLQDLAPLGRPAWHYAVVIGYDRTKDRIVLRSGEEPRRVLSTRRFVRSWRRAGNWGFVALKPGELAASADPDRYLRAVYAYQRVGSPKEVEAAYLAATRRWPASEAAWTALTEARYRTGDLAGAMGAVKTLMDIHPASVAAHNNLAVILNDMGCGASARRAVDDAVRLAREQRRFVGQVADTQSRVLNTESRDGERCY